MMAGTAAAPARTRQFASLRRPRGTRFEFSHRGENGCGSRQPRILVRAPEEAFRWRPDALPDGIVPSLEKSS